MNYKIRLIGISAIGIMLLAGCNNKTQKENKNQTSEEIKENSISVSPVEHSKAFPGAILKISDIQTTETTSSDSVLFKVNYGIENFTLTEATEDHNTHHLANSHDGQHIHFILDNSPYTALYKPAHEVKLKKGTEHYLLSFLSRSYHESIKEPAAFVLKRFKITEDGKYQELELPKTPMLFYSRPKGEYAGNDTKAVLLDFYVLNTELSKDGNKVKAEVNGETFMLDNWQPYKIENLPLSENKIKLTLVDASGNALTGENTSIERTIVLKE
ncbi:hypothetical protein [Elizabethkingia anophelis]|uniref:hypothetical protein n=1 Tax=Elizabethkingia anophelis TaxID=1117645 RepID=UPI001C86CE0F|nr:hypothetical protein [Elizabethkingia anophelis]UTF89048.1 hypothetical protein J2N93_16970 [Elizabethkingia anophelis]UTF99970.1 hypothetical protein J2O04_17185 [Elizabethkingia anophelis]UTG03685.1 hypothetical protein J2O03_16965 [Elizabethkingia anophelis]UTG07427.1 hypothetical protein J2N99_16950 [Elizabethkingia anophelis]UTG11168.1 hypothetical protein J2N92_16950 [Elizabethkingia anophelis]